MHKEIRNQDQVELLPLVSSFKRGYYLSGGTEVALYIRHRCSIDFDLFKQSSINHKKNLSKIAEIRFSSLLDLTVMKAYALGWRSKWKDYVDVFSFERYFTMKEISERAGEIFGELFSAKLFRVQLTYFTDMDYTEEVEYVTPNPPTKEKIKKELIDKATNIF